MSRKHRLNDRLEDYWNHLRADQPMPAPAQVSARHIAELWDSCFVINIEQPEQYRFQHLGMAFLESYGLSFSSSGQKIYEELVETYASRITGHIPPLLSSQEPQFIEESIQHEGNIALKYRLCLFPLGTDQRITSILGGMRWRGNKLAIRF